MKGRTIQSVEEGNTPGWIVFQLGNYMYKADDLLQEGRNGLTRWKEADPRSGDDGEPIQMFLTAFVGGTVGTANATPPQALYFKDKEGYQLVSNVRDKRDPNMSPASAHKLTEESV